MSGRREPRVSSFSSSPADRAAPCTVIQGRSCHQSCSGSGSPCRRRERYGLCGRNAIIRWYRWAHTGGEQAHACGHPDARRAHLVHHRPVVDRDGDLAGAHCGGRDHSDTQQTCSTAGPLCFIHPNAISWAEVPLSLPVPITQHIPGPVFVQWLVIHMRAGGAVLRSLDGEGVFKFFHARLQILDFSLLCFQEEVFDPVEPFRYLCIECLDLLVQCLHILLAGHVGISHRRKLFNCGW